jgi:hypothetical protein
MTDLIATENTDIIISCPNEGGLVRIHDDSSTFLDRIDTTGICFYEGRVFQCLQNTIDTPLEMIVYGEGQNEKLVFPEIRDAHDIIGFDGRLFIVSTGTNEIFELSADRLEILSRVRMKGKGDAWHLNCLEIYRNRLIVSAFGKFRRHRGYKNKTRGAGIVFDYESGDVLFKGFSQPHSPRIIDGALFICNSEEKTVRRIDTTTGETTIFEFENYTRGIAAIDNVIYIGISSSRNIKQHSRQSKIVALDRKTFERVDEINLDCAEVYNICAVPASLELCPVQIETAASFAS